MNPNYLGFEQPIVALQEKIQDLEIMIRDQGVSLEKEVAQLKKKKDQLLRKVFNQLDDWQITQLSRHPLRPYFNDYIPLIFTEFELLQGDRLFAEDPAINGGVARLAGRPVMVLGHQKGRTMEEKVKHNFGMPKPEGYRKAKRLMQMAERFGLPLLTFIDTPGAYPGVEAEERGQSSAIANNLLTLSNLKTPVISIVIGEGGSGGALALGVCDHLMMLEYASYAVISPEGCASILWRDSDKAPQAAAAMGVNAPRLKQLGLIDEVISEGLGGVHRNLDATAALITKQLRTALDALLQHSSSALLERRHQRLSAYGQFDVVND